jgi:hypothetical protein
MEWNDMYRITAALVKYAQEQWPGSTSVCTSTQRFSRSTCIVLIHLHGHLKPWRHAQKAAQNKARRLLLTTITKRFSNNPYKAEKQRTENMHLSGRSYSSVEKPLNDFLRNLVVQPTPNAVQKIQV